jgi:hypothetical protein
MGSLGYIGFDGGELDRENENDHGSALERLFSPDREHGQKEVGIFESASNALSYLFSGIMTIKFWTRVFIVFLIIGSSIGMAIVTYWTFYWNYIPPISHVLPVDFQFGAYPHHESVLPWARVVLAQGEHQPQQVVVISEDNIGHEYGVNPLNCEWMNYNRLLTLDQEYSFTLQLSIPDTFAAPMQDQIGVFMVESRFITCSNTTIWYNRQPFLLPHVSLPGRIISFLSRFIQLWIGWASEVKKISIPLTRKNLILSNNNSSINREMIPSLSMIHISISNPLLRFYDASLHIDAQFNGLQHFMYYWFLTSSSIGIIVLFFFFLIGWLALWIVWWIRKIKNE